MVSLGLSPRSRVHHRAGLLERGDVIFLDQGEMRDAALRLLHVLGDLAAQADDLDALVLPLRRGARGRRRRRCRADRRRDRRGGSGRPRSLTWARSMPRSRARGADGGRGRAPSPAAGSRLRAEPTASPARRRSRSRPRPRRALGLAGAPPARRRRRRLRPLLERLVGDRRGLDRRLRRSAVLATRPRPRPPSVSITTSTEPIGIMSPTSPATSSTLPATGRFHLDRRLVGHHVGELLVFLDAVADLDVPGDDLGLGDAFADIGQLEFVAGHRAQSSNAFLSAGPSRAGPGK